MCVSVLLLFERMAYTKGCVPDSHINAFRVCLCGSSSVMPLSGYAPFLEIKHKTSVCIEPILLHKCHQMSAPVASMLAVSAA